MGMALTMAMKIKTLLQLQLACIAKFLFISNLWTEMMFQILPMAIIMKLSLMMNDISDSVPGPINLYRPLPLHHEPLWRQSSGHRCPAEAILWRVQVIKYTSWALPEFLGFLLLHLKYVPLWHQLISFWNFHCNTYQICSASGVARFLCHFCTSFPCRCLFSLYLSISIYICINIYIYLSQFFCICLAGANFELTMRHECFQDKLCVQLLTYLFKFSAWSWRFNRPQIIHIHNIHK